jgi:hypothetical protein
MSVESEKNVEQNISFFFAHCRSRAAARLALKNKTTLNRIGGIATPKFNNGSNLKIRQRLSQGSCE